MPNYNDDRKAILDKISYEKKNRQKISEDKTSEIEEKVKNLVNDVFFEMYTDSDKVSRGADYFIEDFYQTVLKNARHSILLRLKLRLGMTIMVPLNFYNNVPGLKALVDYLYKVVREKKDNKLGSVTLSVLISEEYSLYLVTTVDTWGFKDISMKAKRVKK